VNSIKMTAMIGTGLIATPMALPKRSPIAVPISISDHIDAMSSIAVGSLPRVLWGRREAAPANTQSSFRNISNRSSALNSTLSPKSNLTVLIVPVNC